MAHVKDMRTQLARAKGSGGLPEGVEHWETERVTAALLGPLSLWGAFQLLRLAGRDRDSLLVWAGRPHNAAALATLIALTARHMQLGLEVVATDYTRGWKRIATKLGIRLGTLLVAVYGLTSIVKIVQARAPER
jgi:succinate dehydrogenase / fumarate reductase membrane anchor subunit